MSEELVFLMGQFEARFPTDRKYAKNHMWALSHGGGYRFGFSAYAVRLLQDVYFLDWDHDPPTRLKEQERIGCVESEKAESDLYAPISGVLTKINQPLLADPSMINVDTYGEGWLLAFEGSGDNLLTPEQYLVHLASSWEVAQRTIKGQFNE